MPKLGRGGRIVLRDLGKPKDANDSIQIFNGPYGLYAKFGKLNVSLPKDIDIEKLEIDAVMKLVDEKFKDKKISISKKKRVSRKKISNSKKSKKQV